MALSLTIKPSDDLDLQIGPITSTAPPHAFLAFSSPAHRLSQRALHTRRGPAKKPSPTSTGIYPSDVAMLIALAQEQRRVLPRKSAYRVCVLSPNELGTYVYVKEAPVASVYLASLLNFEAPLTGTLQVACSVVGIGSDGEQLLYVVNRLLDEAPKLPLGKKDRRKMRKDQGQKRTGST